MTFNMEGPMMSGMWVNPKTGDSFTVKDSFFQDNQYMVQTTDGRLIGYNQLSQYIQTDSKGLEAIKSQAKSKSSADKPVDEVPPEILSMVDQSNGTATRDDSYSVLPDDMDLIYGAKSNRGSVQATNSAPTTVSHQQSEEDIILTRTLRKTTGPACSIDIEWNQYPEKKIDMLTELMDIDIENIVDYYVKQIDINELKDAYTKAVHSYIYSKSNIAVPEESVTTKKSTEMQEKMAKIRAAKKTSKSGKEE